jgi:hypothetical protein
MEVEAMSILNRLVERATKVRRMSQWREPLEVSVATAAKGAVALPGRSYQWTEEYELQATIATRFWCNRAQYSSARRTAERALVHMLYQDVLINLSRLELAISNGDREEAIHWCGEIRNAIEGEP